MKNSNTQPMPEKSQMKKAPVTKYNGIREGQVFTEELKGGKSRLKLCKGIYTDDKGEYYAAFQYVDRKATRQNKEVTVSGKSPFWFEKIPPAQEQGKELFTGKEWEARDLDTKRPFISGTTKSGATDFIAFLDASYKSPGEIKSNAELIASAPRLYRENKELRKKLNDEETKRISAEVALEAICDKEKLAAENKELREALQELLNSLSVQKDIIGRGAFTGGVTRQINKATELLNRK